MNQFLTGDIWEKVNKLLNKRYAVVACIAYVTSEKLKLTSGDTLICDASEFAIKFGQTSAAILDDYVKRGVTVYSNDHLHSKLLLTDSLLIIGSANLSKSSAEKLTESSVVTNNAILMRQAKAFCHNLKDESSLLTRHDIDKLLKIRVIKRPHKPVSKSKTRRKTFGNKCWYLITHPLKERAYNKIKDSVEKTTTVISEKKNIPEDNIGFLRWGVDSQFGKNAKEGDQVVLRFHNESKTQSHIFPPSVILQKEKVNGFYHFYYDVDNTETSKISWTKFLKLRKDFDIRLDGKSKEVSKDELDKLSVAWASI